MRYFEDHYIKFVDILNLSELKYLELITHQPSKINFVLSLGIQKTILSSFLNIKPSSLTIRRTKLGKPYIPSSFLHFNVSYSDKRLVLAVSSSPVGIDVEFHQEIDFSSVSRVFMSSEELELWSKLSDSFRKKYFYKLWSCKEAYLKKLGLGLQVNRLPSFPWLFYLPVCSKQLKKYEFVDLSSEEFTLIVSGFTHQNLIIRKVHSGMCLYKEVQTSSPVGLNLYLT